MSSKLVKERPLIDVPTDTPIINISVHQSGRIIVHAPNTHPRELCKILSGLQYDLLYGSFEMAEKSNILAPVSMPGPITGN